MAYSISPIFNGTTVVDANGVPLSGAKLYTYMSGTATPLATYADLAGTVANSNPIILNARGCAPQEIYLDNDQSYRFRLFDESDVPVGIPLDNVVGVGAVLGWLPDPPAEIVAIVDTALATDAPPALPTDTGYFKSITSALDWAQTISGQVRSVRVVLTSGQTHTFSATASDVYELNATCPVTIENSVAGVQVSVTANLTSADRMRWNVHSDLTMTDLSLTKIEFWQVSGEATVENFTIAAPLVTETALLVDTKGGLHVVGAGTLTIAKGILAIWGALVDEATHTITVSDGQFNLQGGNCQIYSLTSTGNEASSIPPLRQIGGLLYATGAITLDGKTTTVLIEGGGNMQINGNCAWQSTSSGAAQFGIFLVDGANVDIGGNLTATRAHVQIYRNGRIAVGGNFAQDTSAMDGSSATPLIIDHADLDVVGNVTLLHGQLQTTMASVRGGNVYVGGAFTGTADAAIASASRINVTDETTRFEVGGVMTLTRAILTANKASRMALGGFVADIAALAHSIDAVLYASDDAIIVFPNGAAITVTADGLTAAGTPICALNGGVLRWGNNVTVTTTAAVASARVYAFATGRIVGGTNTAFVAAGAAANNITARKNGVMHLPGSTVGPTYSPAVNTIYNIVAGTADLSIIYQ